MASRVVVDPESLDAAADSPQVLAALRAKAERILPTARRLAIAAGATDFANALRLEVGRRPGTKVHGAHKFKRPYARVIAGSEDAEALEYGDKGVSKQAILRRAMNA